MTVENTAENRLGPDLVLAPKHQPATYGGTRAGHGQWVVLYAQGGQVPLGHLWATDTGLGFVPTTEAGIQRVPEFYAAFSAAAVAGTPAMDVFREYAGKASLGLSAGPVSEGDLDTLPE